MIAASRKDILHRGKKDEEAIILWVEAHRSLALQRIKPIKNEIIA